MRFVFPPGGRRRIISAVAGAAILAAAAPAGAAGCTPSASAGSPVFSQFGDTSDYVLAPGGSFESGTSGWTLGVSAVKTGNDSYQIGSGGTHALWAMPGDQPVSAPFCVSADQPSFRFLARRASGSWAEMDIDVLWTDSAGVTHVTSAGGLTPGSGWALTQVYALGRMLPTQSAQTYTVRLRFKPASGGGAVAIDDLYIDPYHRG